jgi:cell division transport system permease protein
MRLRFVISELAISLRRNLLMLFAVVVITAFSLAFFGAALLLRSQVHLSQSYWFERLQVAVYMCTDHSDNPNCPTAVTVDQRLAVQSTLEGLKPLVKSVDYVDQQQAYQLFQKEFADTPDLVRNTSPDALPESFTVQLTDPAKFDVVREAVQNMPGVDQVQDEHSFIKRLLDMARGMRTFAIVMAVVGIAAAVVLIGVAVQVSAASRRRETGIMRLVGASNLFIQLPFLIEGMVAGLCGAVLGFGLVAFTKAFLVDHTLRPVLRVFGSLIDWSAVYSALPYLLVAGVGIAGLASFISLQIYMFRMRT